MATILFDLIEIKYDNILVNDSETINKNITILNINDSSDTIYIHLSFILFACPTQISMSSPLKPILIKWYVLYSFNPGDR